MFTSTRAFADYFANIRRRTLTYIKIIPPTQLEWAPVAGEFTCADIVRHLAAAESMFVGAVAAERWQYQGHTRQDDDTLPTLIASMEENHAQVLDTLRALPDAVLHAPRPTLDGPAIPGWRLLMGLVEHEIHHRSQLAMYLTLLGVTPPHIFGLGVEDVIARATG